MSQSSRRKQSIQLYKWFFTYNNYEAADIVGFRILLNRLCKSYVFQEETGACGTPHLQGSLSLVKKARLEELKKINPSIHWEPTRNCDKADLYCCKEETRTGQIYRKEKMRAFVRTKSKFDDMMPRNDVIEIIEKEPDNRTINWIWSEKGGVGKTSTAAYIEQNYENVCVCNGKGADIKMTVIEHLKENELDVLIINIPRQSEGYVNYGVLEEIKDGLIYSGKYEGGFANIEHPHVIILANFEPDYYAMSEDRWNVVNVD